MGRQDAMKSDMKNGHSVKGWLGQDSRGFTLIELMLTIAILAVISIPILSYFTEAAKHNARNRMKQNSTVAAQDILEEFKNAPYSLDNYNVVCAQSPEWSYKAGPDPSTGEYTITRSLTIDKHTFVVNADITPISGVATTGGIMSIDYKRSVIGSMDTDKDVLASDNGVAYQSAQLFFEDRYLDECSKKTPPVIPSTPVALSIPDKLACTIEIDAQAKGSSGTDDVIVDVNYIYRYVGGNTADGIDLSSFAYTETVESSSIEAKKLNNIYIFYDPLNTGDTVRLKSNANFGSAVNDDQMRLFVIAQSSVAAGKAKPSGYKERSPSYKLTLDSNIAGGNFFNNKIAVVYTNLSQNPAEIMSNGDALFGKLKTKAGSTDYTLVDTEGVNRVARIVVTVLKDTKEYAKVTGSKVQN